MNEWDTISTLIHYLCIYIMFSGQLYCIMFPYLISLACCWILRFSSLANLFCSWLWLAVRSTSSRCWTSSGNSQLMRDNLKQIKTRLASVVHTFNLILDHFIQPLIDCIIHGIPFPDLTSFVFSVTYYLTTYFISYFINHFSQCM